jgi:hypothetical protein
MTVFTMSTECLPSFKKMWLGFIFSLSTALPVFCQTPTKNLVLYFPLDFSRPQQVRDLSNQHNNGIPAGIIVSNSPSLVSMQQTRQLTFAVWIKPDSISGEYPVILSKGGNETGGLYGGYEFLLAWGANDLVFDSGGTQFITRGANGRWVKDHIGEWIHVAFTIDDQTKTAKFYVNGQPTNDEYNEGPRPNDDLIFDLPGNLYIGIPNPASNPNRAKFDGEIRELMIFNRVLSPLEIQRIYQSTDLREEKKKPLTAAL